MPEPRIRTTVRPAPRARTARRTRRSAAVLVPLLSTVLVVTVGALTAGHRLLGGDHDQGGAEGRGTGDALVVSADLQDAIRPADAADTRDLDTFVHRLTTSTPRPPDVLLLTEVLGPGARHVARELRAATGDRYTAVVAPGRTAFAPDGSVRESAIVVNAGTMRLVGKGRFVRVQGEDQAHAVLERRAGGLRLPVVAAHAAGDPLPLVKALHATVGEPGAGRVPVLGGDYRAGRCTDPADHQPVDCAPQDFWTTLTETHGYEDAYLDRSAAPTVRTSGFVFAHGTVDRAGVDTGYATDLPEPERAACKKLFDTGRSAQAQGRCRTHYYADAPFGWALVAAAPRQVRRSAVPTAVTLDRCELGARRGAILARVVNDTGRDVTDTVRVTADEPLTADPVEDTLTVPAGRAATLPIRISAPEETGATDGHVTVTVGGTRTDVAVSLPTECTEAPAVATSYHPGRPPEAAVDGDITTFWHSEYSPPHPLPQSITLNLAQDRKVGKLTYQPRFDGNLNGTITSYRVYVSTDGQRFTEVASGDWPMDARPKTATFPATTARYVRLEATVAHGGSFCSAAEITAQ